MCCKINKNSNNNRYLTEYSVPYFGAGSAAGLGLERGNETKYVRIRIRDGYIVDGGRTADEDRSRPLNFFGTKQTREKKNWGRQAGTFGRFRRFYLPPPVGAVGYFTYLTQSTHTPQKGTGPLSCLKRKKQKCSIAAKPAATLLPPEPTTHAHCTHCTHARFLHPFWLVPSTLAFTHPSPSPAPSNGLASRPFVYHSLSKNKLWAGIRTRVCIFFLFSFFVLFG